MCESVGQNREINYTTHVFKHHLHSPKHPHAVLPADTDYAREPVYGTGGAEHAGWRITGFIIWRRSLQGIGMTDKQLAEAIKGDKFIKSR
jgi:hypothetical protein